MFQVYDRFSTRRIRINMHERNLVGGWGDVGALLLKGVPSPTLSHLHVCSGCYVSNL